MTKIIRTLNLIFLLFIISLPAKSEIYSYIRASTQVSSTRINYEYTIASWSRPPEGTVNPCFQLGLTSSCYANIDHRHTDDGRGGDNTKDTTFRSRCKKQNLSKLKDGREVYDYIYDNCFQGLPYSGKTYHRGDKIRNECVTLFLSASSSSNYGYMYPGAICGVAPPPGGICSFNIDSPNVTLDHGRITDDQIDGNEASKNITISCSKNMIVRIYSVSGKDSKLKLKTNLYSKLTLDDHLMSYASGGVPINIIADYPKDVLLKSTLETTGLVESGIFNGSLSIIMTID
ncbi:MrfJ [Morganella morganii]|uniref:MrpH family fimbial adhesin n=1 Tax=Morganella morganii TaxID=582 RepID=UPI00090797C1|nr:MrfJ [Morganella morganii]